MNSNSMTLGEAQTIDNAMPALQNAGVGMRLRSALNLGISRQGKKWYAYSGITNSGDGSEWDSAFKTIKEAVAAASDGDMIIMLGTFTEAVTCAKKLAFIGAGNSPDACVWMESAAAQTLLTLTGTDCLIANIRFRIPTANGIGINMSLSDYTVIEGCIFQGRTGSYYAIYNNGGSQCKILNNVFCYMNTGTYGTAIFGYTYTAIAAGWEIAGNTFHSNLKHISMTMRQSNIHDNLFQEVGLSSSNGSLTATTKLDIYTGSAGNGQYNSVWKNLMQGDYSNTGGYMANATDNWFGNQADDIAEAEVYDDGTTTTIPAA